MTNDIIVRRLNLLNIIGGLIAVLLVIYLLSSNESSMSTIDVDELSVDIISHYMEMQELTVIKAEGFSNAKVVDGLIVYRIPQAIAEFYEYDSRESAKESYNNYEMHLSEQFKEYIDYSCEFEPNICTLKAGNKYARVLLKGNCLLYVHTEKGFLDSVDELVSAFP